MKTKMLVMSAALALTLLIGCDKNNDMMDSPFTLSPLNGETNVTLNKNIILSFTNPVFHSAVQANFHIMTYQKMTTIRDSMMFNMSMMGMMNHSDSANIYNGMMTMMNQYSMGGSFTWNPDSTECTFDPDSLMTNNTQYAMHMGREMMRVMNVTQGNGMMTQSNHGMMGNAGGMMLGDMITSFITLHN